MAIIAGIGIGYFYGAKYTPNRFGVINAGSNKLNYLLQIIQNSYVDTVDMNSLVEDAMPQIISELDPHSAYIAATRAPSSNSLWCDRDNPSP